MRLGLRLDRLERSWPRPTPPQQIDPRLLTEDELTTYAAIGRKARLVGLSGLTDEEVETAAVIAEKGLGIGQGNAR